MKILIFSMIVVLYFSSCHKDTIIEINIKKLELFRGDDTSHLIEIALKNVSNKKIYLTNFGFNNFISITDQYGKNKKNEYFDDEINYYEIPSIMQKLQSKTDTLLINNSTQKYNEFRNEAISIDYARFVALNKTILIDSVRSKAIKRSLGEKYNDCILIEPYETFHKYVSVNSIYYFKRHYWVSIKFPQEIIPDTYKSNLYCIKRLDGRDEHFFVHYPSSYCENINGYSLFKGELTTKPIAFFADK